MPEIASVLTEFCAKTSDPGFSRPMPEAKAASIPDAAAPDTSPESP